MPTTISAVPIILTGARGEQLDITDPYVVEASGALIQGVRVIGASDPNATMHLEPSGLLAVTSTDGEARGLDQSDRYGVNLDNRGAISVTGRTAYGVYSNAQGHDISNAGSLTVHGDAGAFGLWLHNDASVENSGRIDVYSTTNAVGVFVNHDYSGVIFEHFVNAVGSVISVADATPGLLGDTERDPRNSVGVWFDIGNGVFVNEGLVSADVALRFEPNGNLAEARSVTNETTGVLRGLVDMTNGRDQFVNRGLIEGNVYLDGGDDAFTNDRDGRVVGQVSGGDGADYISGGRFFDNLQGNTGDDHIFGGDGDDWVVGGKDNDTLSGDAGGDLVYGNLGADSCMGGDGNDIVRGGQGNDVCDGGAGDDFVSGDKGDDTVTGGAGADIFHTFGESGIDRVTDFKAVEGDRVLVDAGDHYTVAQVGADVVITIDQSAQMVLQNVQLSTLPPGWIFQG